jgi:hypothetical protein
MKTISHFIAPLLALITMVACAELEVSEEANDSINNGILQELSITGKDFIFDGETRSTVTIGESGASFTWDEDDVIGIFPDKGDQVSFAMEQGAGTQTATFSGGGWALKSSSKYAAYYPHVYENRDITKIPVSYVGQTQIGNANADHIGAYDFMAAGVSTPENGSVAFDMQHLGALVQLTLPVPEPSILNRLVLNTPIKFTKTGTVDLTADTPSIIPETQSNTLDVVLKDITTTQANENVTIYFMMAPVDLTNSVFEASLYFEDGTAFGFEITGKKIEAGRAYRFSVESEDIAPDERVSIPDNQVWVTTTDGTFYTNGDAFGAEVVSINDIDEMCVITFDRDITTISNSAFSGCTTLESITLPNSVTEIKSYAFYNCTGLKKVTLGSGLCSVGDYAFSGCPGELFVNSDITGRWFNMAKFTKIIFGDNVVHIGTDAFNNLTIKDIVWGKNIETIGKRAFNSCDQISNIIIPETVKSIEENAFSYCAGLENLIITDNVTTIGNNAFKSCTNLTNVVIGCNVISIGNNAFEGCNISDMEIPSNVKTIGDNAFQGCSNLKRAIICNTVQGTDSSTTSLGNRAFQDCKSLENITIGGTVTIIGEKAFYHCDNLESVTLSKGVTTIQPSAFCKCKSIKSITIPESVTSIGKEAFYFCESLASVYCKPEIPPTLGSAAFSFNASGRKIYVPHNSVETYKAASYWSNYPSSIEGYDF